MNPKGSVTAAFVIIGVLIAARNIANVGNLLAWVKAPVQSSPQSQNAGPQTVPPGIPGVLYPPGTFPNARG